MDDWLHDEAEASASVHAEVGCSGAHSWTGVADESGMLEVDVLQQRMQTVGFRDGVSVGVENGRKAGYRAGVRDGLACGRAQPADAQGAAQGPAEYYKAAYLRGAMRCEQLRGGRSSCASTHVLTPVTCVPAWW